jgi:protein-glutamine gamma-glutamyltransferase
MPNSIRHIILITLSILLVTHAPFMPLLLIVLLLSLLVIFFITTKKNIVIPKSVNLVAMSIALLLIYVQQGTFFGVEAGVAILISFLFAKVLESQNKRDWVVVFNFALFVSASSFLYSSSLWMTIAVLLSLISCLIGLYRLHQLNFTQAQPSIIRESKLIGQLLLYALPFFIILFLFFPRLPPLWHMPLKSSNATTGMSEQMAPGDIANLSESTDLVFRIVGDIQALPARQDLYWRAMVLDTYDGSTWQADSSNHQPLFKQRQLKPNFSYQYLAAEAQPRWIMGLEYSVPLERGYYIQQDGAIRVARQGNRQAIDLNWLGDYVQQPLNPTLLKRNQSYLEAQDPQAQALAQQLYQQSGAVPTAYIQRVLSWYQQQGFQYTLSPGRLQGDHIDDFLFSKRQGFCEHYASSFVMLMRYVGIPARVVIGYQGGQSAPDKKSWEVRQLDAHAWSEVWLNGRWQRIDPTAAIAPERIEQGLQQSLWQQESAFKQQQLAWGSRVQIWSDFVAYQWQSKVVGYDQNKQMRWLSQFGLSNPLRLILFIALATACLVLSIWGITTGYRYLQQPYYERQLNAFNQSLEQSLQKQNAESHAAWLERLSTYMMDDLAQFLQQLADFDRQYRYGSAKNQPAPQFMKSMLKKCANKLKNQYNSLS